LSRVTSEFVARLHCLFRLPEADDIIQRFTGGRDLHQADRPFAPQLDRDFSHYQDVMGWYNKRPSLWVEPRNQWGKGAVSLMVVVGKITVQLQQTKAARVLVLEGVELQLLRVVQPIGCRCGWATANGSAGR
jgi:hypothetical protein